MPVDPILKPLLDELPTLPPVLDHASFRKQDDAKSDQLFARFGEPGPDVKKRYEVTLPVESGVIDVRIYVPFAEGPHHGHLYLHGGGWTLGSIRQAVVDATCRERCIEAKCVVIAVNYRKAPEHKFPVALNDCYATLHWVAAHAEELGIRLDTLSVGGLSAGANLAAALCLKVRDEGGPAIVFQVLEVPTLELTFSLPSIGELASGYGLTRRAMEQHCRDYLIDDGGATHPYASPLLASSLKGLPPAHIMTAEYDLLRDDGAAYAARLRDDGVAVSYSMHRGHIHGSSSFTKVMPSARAWREELLSVLRRVSAAQDVPAGLVAFS